MKNKYFFKLKIYDTFRIFNFNKKNNCFLYANGGNIEDYEKLQRLGYNLSSGYIAFIKYGGGNGGKIINAAQFGIKGVIAFWNQPNNLNTRKTCFFK